MSTLMNYTYQSFAMRGREKILAVLRPHHEHRGQGRGSHRDRFRRHQLLSEWPADRLRRFRQPGRRAWKSLPGGIFGGHYIASAQTALPVDSRGIGWTGDYVFSSGNLILDLLHNFFLENGARTQKLRVYEMTDNPAARTMLGYLFVRGGVHALAYARALESLTGVKMSDMLPIPNIGNAVFPEACKFMEQGLHLKLYRFSPEDYKEAGTLWRREGARRICRGFGGKQ